MTSRSHVAVDGTLSVGLTADARSIRLLLKQSDDKRAACTVYARDAVNVAVSILQAVAATDAIGAGRAADMLRLCDLNPLGWADDFSS